MLDEGKIADAGTHGELMERCSIYREIYESQREGCRNERGRKQPPMGMGPGPGGPGARAARGGFQKPKNAGKTLRRLLPYLTARKSLLAVVFACVLISSGSAIAGGYRLRPIINTYLVGGLTDLRGFALAILGLGGIYLAGALATWLQNKIMVNLAQHGANRLRKDLFDHLQTLPLSYFDATPTANS